MKKGILLIACLVSVYVSAATWSFSGGYIYFDNSQTQWTDECFMLVIGKADYSSVYEMCPIDNPKSGKSQVTSNWWYTALPSSGWSDAEYMAIITSSKPWRKGTWGQDNLVNANHYAVYTAGLTAKANQGFQFAVNDHTLKLTYLGDSYHGVSFTDAEKNACTNSMQPIKPSHLSSLRLQSASTPHALPSHASIPMALSPLGTKQMKRTD